MHKLIITKYLPRQLKVSTPLPPARHALFPNAHRPQRFKIPYTYRAVRTTSIRHFEVKQLKTPNATILKPSQYCRNLACATASFYALDVKMTRLIEIYWNMISSYKHTKDI
jgi:hypothetical protein